MRIGALILLVLAPLAESQESGSALDAAAAYDRIGSCVDEVEKAFTGLDSLPAICPGIDDALAETGYTDFISKADAAYFDWDSLQDLHEIADRYRRAEVDAPDQAVPNLALLPQVLKELERKPIGDRPLTWRERLRRWLDTLLQRADADQDSWLARWLSQLEVPQWLGRSLINTAIVLVLLIALLVIGSELRAARIFRRGRAHRGADLPVDEAGGGRSHLALADLATIPPGDRPAMLLRLLVDTLVATGRLHSERSLTHVELASRAAFDGADQRASFNRVAALCERILYGNESAATHEIDAVVQTGSTLNDQLRGQVAGT